MLVMIVEMNWLNLNGVVEVRDGHGGEKAEVIEMRGPSVEHANSSEFCTVTGLVELVLKTLADQGWSRE